MKRAGFVFQWGKLLVACACACSAGFEAETSFVNKGNRAEGKGIPPFFAASRSHSMYYVVMARNNGKRQWLLDRTCVVMA